MKILVVDARLRRRLRLQLAQALARLDLGHLVVGDLDGFERARRAHLRAARLLPAAVEQMRVEEPVLRQLQIFVPANRAVRARVGDGLLALRLDGVDMDDPVVALRHRSVLRRRDARRVVAVLAHHGQIRDVHERTRAALAAADVDPTMLVAGHRRRIAFELVADVLVLIRERAAIAVRALRDVDDEIPLLHLLSFRRGQATATLVLPWFVLVRSLPAHPAATSRRLSIAPPGSSSSSRSSSGPC